MHDEVANISNLVFSWPGDAVPVLDIDQLSVERGRHLFIQGASGCGKTTLLNLLSGICQPDAGSVRVLNQDLNVLNVLQRDRFRADHLGVIFQQFNLLPYLDILENVCLPCSFSKRRKRKPTPTSIRHTIQTSRRRKIDRHIVRIWVQIQVR